MNLHEIAMDSQTDEFCLVEPLAPIRDDTFHETRTSQHVDGIEFGEQAGDKSPQLKNSSRTSDLFLLGVIEATKKYYNTTKYSGTVWLCIYYTSAAPSDWLVQQRSEPFVVLVFQKF